MKTLLFEVLNILKVIISVFHVKLKDIEWSSTAPHPRHCYLLLRVQSTVLSCTLKERSLEPRKMKDLSVIIRRGWIT